MTIYSWLLHVVLGSFRRIYYIHVVAPMIIIVLQIWKNKLLEIRYLKNPMFFITHKCSFLLVLLLGWEMCFHWVFISHKFTSTSLNSVHVYAIFINIPECPSGSYWLACTLTCGNCRDVNQCNHINGTCLTGCSAGYMGDLCKTREYTCVCIYSWK